MTKQRVVWLGIFLVILLSMVISGCAGGSQKTSEKTFTFGFHSDATNLDPQVGIDSQSTNVTNRKIYENLVTVDQKGQIIPMLATEWKQIDPLTLELTLRKGVKFHDGTDFNAEAVKATFDRLLDPDKPKARRTMFSPVVAIKVIDNEKIQFITDKPFAPLLLHLAHPAGAIMSPKAIEADVKGEKKLTEHPVGTGPLVFESWVRGDAITLKKNENYWGTPLAFSKMVFKTIPEDMTRMAMVKKGEIQGAEMVPVTEAERLSKESDMRLLRSLSYRVEFLALNVSKGPLANPKVRQAISETLDFDAILTGVYSGVGKKEVSNLSPDVFGYNPNLVPYEKNLEHAKQLMAEAGYSDGFQVNLITADRKIRIKLAEVIQAQLKEIGIQVEIRTMEFGAYIEESKKGTFDLNLTGWSNQTGDADYCYAAPYTKAGFTTGENNSRYDDAQVNTWIQEARQETDVEKRRGIYWKIQEKIREDRPTLTTQVTEFLLVTQKNIEGLWITPGGVLVINDLKIN